MSKKQHAWLIIKCFGPFLLVVVVLAYVAGWIAGS